MMTSKIKSIKKVGKGRVMDLTVHKNHTIVTKNGIVSHNCDYLSANAMGSLRNIIGDVNAQFILIGNYPHKIIPALKSRCAVINFDQLNEEQFLTRMIQILDSEKVSFDNDTLMSHYNTHYPDLRKTIGSMEMSTINHTLHTPVSETTSQVTDWMQISMVYFADGKLEDGRKTILDNITYEDYDFFYEFLYKNTDIFAQGNPDKRDACIIAIADAIVADTASANREINLSACLAKLGRIYRK